MIMGCALTLRDASDDLHASQRLYREHADL
jgi:hypothetical protein